METLKELGLRLWGFISNPPVEVTSATLKLVNDSTKCLSDNLSAFATSILDSFKGIF